MTEYTDSAHIDTDGAEELSARARRLSNLLLGAGVLHFVAPTPFDSIIPPQLPGQPRGYTYASGVAELVISGLLRRPKTRHLGGGAAAALFIAVFPANVEMARQWRDKPLLARALAYGRLPLQIPLITSAIRIAGDRSPQTPAT